MNMPVINNNVNTFTPIQQNQKQGQDMQQAQFEPVGNNAAAQPANETQSTPTQQLQGDMRQIQIQRQITAAEPEIQADQITAQTTQPETYALQTDAASAEPPAPTPDTQTEQGVQQQPYQDQNQGQNPLLNIIG